MQVIPHPKFKRDYVGKRVRTTRQLCNGYVAIPAGNVGTVVSHSPRGSNLEFEPCTCCGMSARISQVAPADLEFIAPDDAPYVGSELTGGSDAV